MEKIIHSVAELQQQGKRFARLVDNRDFDQKDLKAKKASLKEKGQLIPAIIVDGKKAVDDGLEIVDFETGDSITDPTNYLVIIEGNHRYQAHLQLLADNITAKEKYNKDFYVMYPLNDSDSIDSMFKEMNISTNPWKPKDYLKEVTRKTEYELVKEVNELVKEGYSIPSASMWMTLRSAISSTVIKKLSAGKDITESVKITLSATSNIETGKELIKLSQKAFNDKFVKSRLLATWVTGKIEASGVSGAENTINKIKQMFENLANDKATAEKIVKADKNDRQSGDTKESFVRRMLNEQFEKAAPQL